MTMPSAGMLMMVSGEGVGKEAGEEVVMSHDKSSSILDRFHNFAGLSGQ